MCMIRARQYPQARGPTFEEPWTVHEPWVQVIFWSTANIFNMSRCILGKRGYVKHASLFIYIKILHGWEPKRMVFCRYWRLSARLLFFFLFFSYCITYKAVLRYAVSVMCFEQTTQKVASRRRSFLPLIRSEAVAVDRRFLFRIMVVV